MRARGLRAAGRALAVWLLMMIAESVHGALRRGLAGGDPDLATRQAGVLIGSLIIFLITLACLGWMRIRGPRQALAVGVSWSLLTLGFEVGLGRALDLPWARIWRDYDLAQGGLMPLGLAAMALSPLLCLRLQPMISIKAKRPSLADADDAGGSP